MLNFLNDPLVLVANLLTLVIAFTVHDDLRIGRVRVSAGLAPVGLAAVVPEVEDVDDADLDADDDEGSASAYLDTVTIGETAQVRPRSMLT